MRNVSLVIFVTIFIASCSPFFLNTEGYTVNSMPLDEAWRIVSSYTYIPDGRPSLKSPRQFEADGGGDCEDFAAYMMYLLGDNTELVIIEYKDAWHAIVCYNGLYIEPGRYGKYYKSFVEVKRYSYMQILQLATLAGIKSMN